MMVAVTENLYRVHFYEIDSKQRILPTALVNYFQDIAVFQSENVGVGIDYLQNNNLAWSLYQWDISIKKYPLFGQEINVITRPCVFDKCNAYREFKVKDENGETIASAYSRWVLLDTEKMKLAKIPPGIYEVYGIDPNESKPEKMTKPREASQTDYQKEFTVGYCDIDTNKHLNNSKYIEWAIHTLPHEIPLSYSLNEVKVLYKKEAKIGEIVQVRTELMEDNKKIIGLHKIIDENDKTLCLLENAWEALEA